MVGDVPDVITQDRSQKCEIGGGQIMKVEGQQVERRRRENREAPRIEAPRGVGFGEGVSPFPMGDGSGEGIVPSPQKIPPPQNFLKIYVLVCCILGAILCIFRHNNACTK